LIIITLALMGWHGRQCAECIRDVCCGQRTAEEEQLVVEEEEDERKIANFPARY
jgi:hypothetical protein